METERKELMIRYWKMWLKILKVPVAAIKNF
ncbi:MAG: hypothetical protein WDO19_03270 [Bacteroidota bacterium]